MPKATYIAMGLLLFAMCPINTENNQLFAQDSEPDTLQTQNTRGQSSPSFFNVIGFYMDIYGGVSARFNGYNTTPGGLNNQPLSVDYSSQALSSGSFSLETGLLNRKFIDFEYERPLAQTSFNEEALGYQEDISQGLEKYTFGIDMGPLVEILIPGDINWFLRRILSVRFRTFRELSQTEATVGENSLIVTSQTQLQNGSVSSTDLANLPDGSSYSFRTRYSYQSIDIPIFLYSSTKYDHSGDEGDVISIDRQPGNQQVSFWLGTGVSNWNFRRPFATRLPHLGNQQVVYDTQNEIYGYNLELSFDVRDAAWSKWWYSLRSVTRAGFGVKKDVSNPHVDLNRLLLDSDSDELDTGNYFIESTFTSGFSMFPESQSVDLIIKPGFTFRFFQTEFSNLAAGSSGDSNDEPYEKTDSLYYTMLKIALHI